MSKAVHIYIVFKPVELKQPYVVHAIKRFVSSKNKTQMVSVNPCIKSKTERNR